MALDDTVSICVELRSELDAVFPAIASAVCADLVHSEMISRSVGSKCSQSLRRSTDECARKMNAALKREMEKLHTEHCRKTKVYVRGSGRPGQEGQPQRRFKKF